MKTAMKLFALILLLSGAAAAQAQTVDLFFSEYVEGSSNNKALEIFNGTADAIDLSQYEVLRYSNGTTMAFAIALDAATLAPGETHVLTHTYADADLLAVADQTSTELNFNGNDALVLSRGGLIVDSFGQVGFDPGASWSCSEGTTANQTLRRRPDVCNGDADSSDVFDPCVEYLFFSQDTFDGLGFHLTDCVSVGTGHESWDALKANYR